MTLQIPICGVKGHANLPENERWDELAVNAAMGGGLLEDVWYEG